MSAEVIAVWCAVALLVVVIPFWVYAAYQILKLRRFTKIQEAWNKRNRRGDA